MYTNSGQYSCRQHDRLEPIPGLKERWGKTVLHCRYCHGFEFSDRPLGVLARTPMSVHQACLVVEWGPTTLFLNGVELEPEGRGLLARHGVTVELRKIKRLVGEGSELSAVEFEDGSQRPVVALYVAPQSSLSSPIAAQLGAAIDDGPVGPIIRTDADRPPCRVCMQPATSRGRPQRELVGGRRGSPRGRLSTGYLCSAEDRAWALYDFVCPLAVNRPSH